MPFVEKPPILTGRQEDDMLAMHDYLFRMAQSINEIVPANDTEQTAVKTTRDKNGRNVHTPVSGGGGDADLETVRKNARELRALILKSAENLQNEIDSIQFSTFYIKYADDFAGDYPAAMYDVPTNSTYYMGVCSSTSPQAPTDPSVYSWSRVKGNGGTGLNSATVFLYRRSNNPPPRPRAELEYTFASGKLDLGDASVSGHKLVDADVSATGHKVTLNTAEVEGHLASVTGWTQEIPDSDGRPCWVITATAIATTATDTIAASEWSEAKKLVEDGERGQDGANGQDGARGSDGRDGLNGADGRGISQTTISYGTSSSAATEPETWSDSVPGSLVKGTWLWVKTDILYTDGDEDTSYSKSYIGTDGEDGVGLAVQSATKSGGTTTVVIADTDGHTTTLTINDGEDGDNGTPGTDGLSGYVHTAWANSADGATDFSTTVSAGKKYLGVYTDNTEQDSTNYQDYSWSLIKGADGQNGTNGTNGTNGYNTAIVYLYTRSASAPSAIAYSGSIKYTFSSGALASVPEGWSQTIPATDGDKKLYVTAATARSRSTSVNIAASAWATPVLMAENGQQGIQGPQGPSGQTTYLHIKYSDDGETFTGNDGEDLGAFIGTYTDYTEEDSDDFSAYRWHRFSDDTEMRALITTSQNYVISYVDQKEETYNGRYLAQTDFGTFEENLTARIEESARGVVEGYDYSSRITAIQDSINRVDDYFAKVNGEIRRGIVYDPSIEDYVIGIAISQNLQFSGECGRDDPNNPQDGFTYYYIEGDQTFGLYTSDGWQFWIRGTKRGWFNSVDGMLHVRNILAEDTLQIGPDWQFRAFHDSRELEILFVGE